MQIIKKIVKTVSMIVSVIIIIFLLALLVLSVLHRVRLKSNKEFLAEQGFYNPISAGNHSLNLVKYGDAKEGHRIIALAGNGSGFPIEFQNLADELCVENQVWYLARAGYDGSDDVKDEMTAEFVVEDYRKTLQSAGIEAPYVLLPHSYAGILASYWVSKYPDEIEAMISLDGIPAQVFTDEQIQSSEEEASALTSLKVVMNTGIGDAAIRVFNPEEPEYSEEEQRMSDAMLLMTMGTSAFSSEMRNTIDNISETWKIIQTNDVPKLYISSENGYQNAEELQAADVLSEYRINQLTEDFQGTEEERRAKAYELEWEEMQKYKKEKIQPYTEKLGNCKIVNLPGSHFIHYEKPHECAEIIKEFLGTLS